MIVKEINVLADVAQIHLLKKVTIIIADIGEERDPDPDQNPGRDLENQNLKKENLGETLILIVT
jgi:hypothetical protein